MFNNRSKLRRRLEAAGFALLAVALALGLYSANVEFLDKLDNTARDVVFKLRQAPEPNDAVAVVSIDELAAKTHGRWPWPRSKQAELIKHLDDLGAAVIALDITYTVADDPAQDQILIDTLSNSIAPVIGGYFMRKQQTVPPSEAALAQLYKNRIKVVRKLPDATDESTENIEFPFAETNIAPIAKAMTSLGLFNAIPDTDGLVRKAPLVLRYGGQLYPGLSIQVLATATNSPPAITIGKNGITALQLAGLPIPVDSEGLLTLNYYDPSNDIAGVSAAHVLDGSVDPEQIAGKIIFIGATELGINDVVPTPLAESYPGTFVHATAISNILSQQFFIGGDDVLFENALMIGGLPLLLMLLMMLSTRLSWLMISLAITLGITWAVFYYLVAHEGMLVSVIYPALALIIGLVVFQMYYALTAEMTAGFLRKAFASYVSPALVEQLINDPEQLSLGGQTREITILFSDIRSFTTISESMQPQELVKMLNVYLGEMTDIVMNEKGTVDKYIGDAVMAFFNAPVDVPAHPIHAAESALTMQESLIRLNQGFIAQFDQQLAIGIGLHTGKAVIGNIGAEKRFDYTAIGDTINLGARLESATKQYAVEILISQATHNALDSRFICRKVDRIQVKGKTEGVEIYQLMGRSGNEQLSKLAVGFEEALQHYFDTEFTQAANRFDRLAGKYNDKTSAIFSERCRHFLQNPPPQNWDGVFVATSK